jgi:hypothetical protein
MVDIISNADPVKLVHPSLGVLSLIHLLGIFHVIRIRVNVNDLIVFHVVWPGCLEVPRVWLNYPIVTRLVCLFG